MIPDIAIAILHSIGATMLIYLAVEVWLRWRDVYAAMLRFVLGIWFARLALAWWHEVGYDGLYWAQSNYTIFYTALGMYVVFFLADRNRWWKERNR